MKKKLCLSLLGLSFILYLSACGQYGPLYLPNKATPPTTNGVNSND